ncbi:MAG: SDR family NAD(P)-dependent oxidoreductase [Betaproteobacteria bacterium]|nr:SDR family NAD(P)-dependent oxidoreductase [Betaproteobacteria bacterium]
MALNPPIRDWQDRRCWIIGASTGIGAALADKLAAKGARVALSARRAGPLEEMAFRHGKDRALALPLDITDAPALDKAAAKLAKAWGGIDLVVLMAGEYKPMRAWELDLKVARTMIEVNLMGYFNALAAVVPRLLEQGSGTIALVSSVAGYRGLPKSLVYGPTKAAVINLAETLYLDLNPKGIGVCVVNPGFVKTPMTDPNDFRMPALIEAPEAADEIVKGLEAGEFEIHFPKRFTRFLKVLQLLPYSRYFPAVRKATGL